MLDIETINAELDKLTAEREKLKLEHDKLKKEYNAILMDLQRFKGKLEQADDNFSAVIEKLADA